MAGEIARKFLELVQDLNEDDTIMELEKLRNLPIPEAEKWHQQALSDYLTAKFEGTWDIEE